MKLFSTWFFSFFMITLLVVAFLALAGCVTTPQTREDFKTWTTQHTTMGFTGTHSVDRPFESTVASLQKKWEQCYNLDVTTTRRAGGMTTSRYQDSFHPRLKKTGSSLVELTLQMTTQGMVMLNKVPEGGEYKVALDIRRQSQNKTTLTWHSYSPGGWRDAWELNKRWAEGKDAPCQ